MQKPPAHASSAKGVDDPFQASMLALAPTLRAYAGGLARDGSAADDLVQETMLKALRNREKFRDGSNLKAWLFTILRNHFLSEVRRNARLVVNSDLVENERAPWTPAAQEDALRLYEVAAMIGRLPKRLRRALIIVGAEGHSYEQAAHMEGCAIGTIKSRVSRARAALTQRPRPADPAQ